eukprot:gene40399-42786_t
MKAGEDAEPGDARDSLNLGEGAERKGSRTSVFGVARTLQLARKASGLSTGSRTSSCLRRGLTRHSSVGVASSDGGAAPQFLLSFAELDYIFFEEVRDMRLHTAVAVDLCKTLYGRGLLGGRGQQED